MTLVLLFSLGIGNAWAGGANYYSAITASSSATAKGLVYAATSNTEGAIGDYTNSTTATSDDLGKSTAGDLYVWAKAARSYEFNGWTLGGQGNPSFTNSTNSMSTAAVISVTSPGGDNTATNTATASAAFKDATAYTLTFKRPENFGGYTAEYANYTISNNKFVDYTKTITMTSSTSDKAETSYASDKVTLTATARTGNFLGWYVNGSKVSDKADGYTFNPSATCTIEGRWEEVQTNIPMHFKAVEQDDDSNYKGYYTVGAQNVQATDYNTTTGSNYYFEATLTAYPADGYVFTGWYTKEGKKKTFVSYDKTYNAYFDTETTLYANFTFSNYTDDQKAQFKVGSQYFLDLNAANTAAGSNGTIVCTRDGILPPGNYTISNGVTLLIPYDDNNTLKTTSPNKVSQTYTAVSTYRKLILTEGANITVNGAISVGGSYVSSSSALSATSGSPGRITGPCGVIDMSQGGHLSVNGALYCWGFIQGQDKNQGNNTINVGTIDINSGAVVYEDFVIGEWRGGDVSVTMNSNADTYKTFPFNNYFVQNVEVPMTIHNGASEKCGVSFNVSSSDYPTTFTLIGAKDALFKLNGTGAAVTKWYDATTDHMCVELSGASALSALKMTIGGGLMSADINSDDYILPIPSSMRLIFKDCDVTLSSEVGLLPGAIMEFTNSSKATITSNIYLYDQNEWNYYCLSTSEYFVTYDWILTDHKKRDKTKKTSVDDAQLIVDGDVTVSSTGKLFSTATGANICGNGGGTLTFQNTMPFDNSTVYQFLGAGTTATAYKVSTMRNGDRYYTPITMSAANLCNDDGSYTKSAQQKFYNVNGRWFVTGKQNEKTDHTYDFTYLASGNSGDDVNTDAVYSNDKTGLEARMKWANVTADACENWWQGQGAQSSWFYNYSLNSAWHQFIPMASPDGWFSGSDNNLYEKSGCTWNSVGEVDENCLYTIGGVKKALVNGNLIQLEKNTEDEAFHNTAATTEYYICFEGCNWHSATKLANEEKAYKVETDTFIWYNDAWMAVEYEKPFFYTLDETNVKVYYEYVGDEWVEATPAVKVKDDIETRYFYFVADAFTVANGKKNTTITLLKDIPTITTALIYSAKNTTCTLDLNGHVLPGSVTSMLKIDASGSTFTITDNSENKDGRIQLTVNENARRYGVNLAKGNLILNAGTIKAVNTKAYNSSSAASTQICALYAQVGTTFTMNGGSIIAEAAYNPFGIYVVRNASTNTTVTINNGTVHAESTQISAPYAVYGNGTVDMNNGLVEAVSMTSDAHGIYSIADAGGFAGKVTLTGGEVKAYTTTSSAYGIRLGANASGNAKATLTMSGGTVTATAKTNTAMGIYVGRDLTYDTNEPRNITKYHFPEATISNGTVRANTQTNTGSEAIRSYGNLTITGGTFLSVAGISGEDFTATPTKNSAYGLHLYGGEAHISGSPTFTVKAAGSAYGIAQSDTQPSDKGGAIYNNTTTIDGGTFNVTTVTGASAYGAFVSAKSRPVTTTHASNSSYYAGNYANAGTLIINNGTFNVTAATTNAYGIYLEPAVSESGASGYTTATAAPVCTVNNGTITATALTAIAHGAYVSKGATLTVVDGTLKGKLTRVAADGWATGTQVLGGGTLVATGGTFIGESANSSLSSKQKSYAAGILASTHSTNGGSNVSVSNATLRGELKSTYLSNGGSTEWVGGAYGLYSKTVNDLTLTNCTLQAVSAYQGGFGIRLINTPAEIHDCTATINTTYAYNYGIFTEGTADAKVYNSSFTDISGTTWAYGAYVYGGALTAENCEFHSTTQQSTATSTADCNLHGIKVNTGNSLTLTGCVVTATGNASYSQNGYGLYVDGSADVTNSEITISSVKKNAYAVFNTANTTLINLHSGKFKASAGSGTVLACNGTAAAAKQVITGGYYSHNTNLSNYAAAPYHVFTLPTTDTEYPNGYRYEVAEAYTLAWATDGDDLTGDYTNGLTKVGATLVAPNTPTKTGYTFADWTPSVATTMPAANTTYTATWTPNTNTAYTVKHYKEKLEGGYNAEPDETDNLTGTTGAEVTPAVKNYPGFTAPSTQTVTILANGSRVVTYQYTRNSHKVTWNATENGGSCATEYTMVKTGATIGTLPEATKTGHDFLGWFTTISGGGNQVTAATMITNKITFYARFTPQTYDITYKDQGNEEFSGVHGAGYPTTHTYGTATALVNPTKEGYTFNGWYDNAGCTGAALTEIGVAAYTDDFTLYAKWTASICTITWRNYNEDFLGTSTIQPGGKPGYSTVQHGVPTRDAAGGKIYEWDGWTTEPNGAGTFYAKDELPAAAGDATYYAHFRIKSIEVEASDDIDIDEDTNVETTIVHVQGALTVAPSATLTTQDLILEATPGTSGEIIGTVEATEHAYFDLSNGAEGFKARTWYAVAVPWQVAVPAYDIPHCGVYITNDGEHYTQQELGSSFDLIYYDGALRAAQGPVNDCWRFVEDDASDVHIMYPGRAYMIYLTSDAQTIRFERKSGADLQITTLAVDTWGIGNAKDMNWNGIANPATYHAYINANAGTYQGTANAGQIYHAESRSYSVVDLSQYDLVVGQPVFVQATAKNQSVAAISSHNVSAPYYAPRRSGNWTAPVTRYTVSLAADEAEASDRVIVCMDEDKEQDTYVIGQDLMKMGVSSVIPQLYINRYDGQMCVNTAAPVNNRTDYPLGIYVPQAGEYNLFINDQPNDETMLYLTLDGEIIWNLSYGGYVVNLDKGTTNRFGLRMIASAPQVTTGVEEALINAQGETRKVLINDKVFIIRGDNVYSADGQLVK